MRILYCSMTYPPHLNGEAIFTKSLAEGMVNHGHTGMVLIPGESRFPTQDYSHGIQLVRLPAIGFTRIHQDLRLAFVPAFHLHRIFQEFQPEIVHIQDPSPLCQAVLREARRWNIPIVITHHSGPEVTAPYLRIDNPALKKLTTWASWNMIIKHLAQGDVVTVPSRYSAQMLRERGLQADVQIVPCGVELADFYPKSSLDRKAVRQQYGLALDKTLFLYVGRVDHEKNLDTILKAMAIAKRNDIQFAIAGQGLQESYLQQLAVQLDLDPQVHFLGQLNPSSLPDLLNSADIFVMPGKAESFSIATLEAMACAKPILAANAAALPESVTHFVNGYLFQPLQPEDAARGIEMLASCRDQWSIMGNASLAKARHYGLNQVVQNYEHLYNTCIERQRVSALAMTKKIRAVQTKHSAHEKICRPFALSFLRAALLILILLFSTFVYDQVQAFSDLRLSDLAPLELAPATNLLVISPHPDDELLAAGGLIQRVLESGGRVEVALVTNGDGQYIAPLLINRKVRPEPADYIDIGRRRQTETLTALGELGLRPEQVTFLGYPDGRINNIWVSDWQQANPVRAPYTHTTKSPYENTYDQEAVYRGLDLSKDLKDILEKNQPDVILLPHPEDTNSDHSAVSNFAQFAIANYLATGNHKTPLVLAYLVHYEAYPVPRGEDTSKALLPPAPLSNGGEGWVTFSLSDGERRNKRDALRAYFSQQRMTPGYLQSFARANEIFFELPIIEMPLIVLEDHPVLETDLQTDTTLFEPARERFDRLVLKSADLVGWKVSRLGDLVCFAAETRGPIAGNMDYRILAKLPDGNIMQISKKEESITFADRHFGACFSLSDLGDPSAIGFAAETRLSLLLDRTAWHFVYISKE